MHLEQTYSIPVVIIKTSEDFSYSAIDTVENFKQRILESKGIPVGQQRLHVQYGWRRLWQRVDISDLKTDLLINHLQTALSVHLYFRATVA